jgi:hypothetical protein
MSFGFGLGLNVATRYGDAKPKTGHLPRSCFRNIKLELEDELLGVPGLVDVGRLLGYWEEEDEAGFEVVRVGGIVSV